jgi:hypothetical protein
MNQFANANHAEVGVISLIQASLEFILGVPWKLVYLLNIWSINKLGAGNQLESVNVFHEIIQQLKTVDRQSKPIFPDYFVHSAGTGKG